MMIVVFLETDYLIASGGGETVLLRYEEDVAQRKL